MTEQVTVDEGANTTTVLTDATYEKIKVFVQLWLPAFMTLYLGIAQLWGIPSPEKVVGTVALITTFLGVVLRISTTRYNKSDQPYDGEMEVIVDGGGVKGYNLVLQGDPEALADKDKISFKVQKHT